MTDDPRSGDEAWRESRAAIILMAVAVGSVLIFGAFTLVAQFAGAGTP